MFHDVHLWWKLNLDEVYNTFSSFSFFSFWHLGLRNCQLLLVSHPELVKVTLPFRKDHVDLRSSHHSNYQKWPEISDVQYYSVVSSICLKDYDWTGWDEVPLNKGALKTFCSENCMPLHWSGFSDKFTTSILHLSQVSDWKWLWPSALSLTFKVYFSKRSKFTITQRSRL